MLPVSDQREKLQVTCLAICTVFSHETLRGLKLVVYLLSEVTKSIFFTCPWIAVYECKVLTRKGMFS